MLFIIGAARGYTQYTSRPGKHAATIFYHLVVRERVNDVILFR